MNLYMGYFAAEENTEADIRHLINTYIQADSAQVS